MFHKILVAEDLDSISMTVVQALEELSVVEIHHAKYCDDAFLKIKKALHDEEPFDLLISDLSFKPDHRENRLSTGEELIDAVKKLQPNIKMIIFSIEDKSFRIKSLFNNSGINAYVSKGRNSIPQLKNAIQNIFNNDEKIISTDLSHLLRDKSILEIEAYDISLLKFLSKGLILDEIALEFKKSGIIPNGSSSIEKRINKLKIYFKASNNVHLISITKDLGLV
ncbi:DNA-binding transcriptional response regulator [Flavobacterium gawalongense]|uniref:Response regulator transcription factor n=1 Tax=Flavobacterium gawalongense TaxID=2594432 RepID=A0A553BBK1_9FLAO|nr:response regulator [Flavobacterium gawalongense]TRW98001.1 response regulator transcription factor [Flavobacterium gawalongense]TRX02500.1 response regulator transcription factor [Flavobacterium gawalongense]TRX05617.1 response regulator transcription factor [Flavobacterium gawalongense]TRX06500.1 response regulator transcription factor [Flavobacterium gawalongense]TRX25042.1 response regulator transcription factor [Flavobacterium gawalongense]